MSLSVAAEKIETGDRIEVPFEEGVVIAIVSRVTEGTVIRSLDLSSNGRSFELAVERGHAVNLVC